MVCKGHNEIQAVKKMIQQAQYVESGAGVTLADAESITANDVRMPTTAHTAQEKLYAFSVLVDIFHGANQAISTNVRRMASAIGPVLPTIVAQAATEALGMNQVHRVLFDVQQTYFRYCTRIGSDEQNVIVPDFHEVLDKVQTYRADALSDIPASWRSYLDSPAPRSSNQRKRELSAKARNAVDVNAKADQAIIRRFESGEWATISDMLKDKEFTMPQHNGADVCLSWALKGRCTMGCKRANQHKTYNSTTNKAINQLLTACGADGHTDS